MVFKVKQIRQSAEGQLVGSHLPPGARQAEATACSEKPLYKEGLRGFVRL
jgi:hypothetical protein